jgi:hypothetical protein
MHSEHLRHIACPFCTTAIQFDRVLHEESGRIEFATTGEVAYRGPRVQTLVDLLKSGQHVRAMSLLLAPVPDAGKLFPRFRFSISPPTNGQRRAATENQSTRRRQLRLPGIMSRIAGRLSRGFWEPRAKMRLAEFLYNNRDRLSARDVIDIYFRQFSGVEIANHFEFYFGQPRHLAHLATAALLERSEGPILDLACGAATVRESWRLLNDGGLLIVSRFGNRDVEPNEGYELSLAGYRELFSGFPTVFFSQDQLIDCYLAMSRVDVSLAQESGQIEDQKWLSAVASRTLRNESPINASLGRSHGVGRLQLNPIYSVTGVNADGSMDLQFEAPSDWYDFENARYRDYAAQQVRISSQDLRDIEQQNRTDSIERLIEQFVVVGMPDRLLKAA